MGGSWGRREQGVDTGLRGSSGLRWASRWPEDEEHGEVKGLVN